MRDLIMISPFVWFVNQISHSKEGFFFYNSSKKNYFVLYFELQSFTAKVERGSSVQFTWVIDDLEKSTHEGESYSVVFKKSSQHKLKVT